MASAEDQVENIIGGKWKFKEDVNTAECMRHIGYPETAVKMMLDMRPLMCIERKGDTFDMDFQMVAGHHMKYTFKLGEEIDVLDKDNDPPMYYNKETLTFENGVVKLVTKSQLKGPLSVDTETHLIKVGDVLYNLMSKVGDRTNIGNRIFERDC